MIFFKINSCILIITLVTLKNLNAKPVTNLEIESSMTAVLDVKCNAGFSPKCQIFCSFFYRVEHLRKMQMSVNLHGESTEKILLM